MNKIKIGDIVRVNFNNSQFTLCSNAKVLYMPLFSGDSWIFEDEEIKCVYYVNEGCTISKIYK